MREVLFHSRRGGAEVAIERDARRIIIPRALVKRPKVNEEGTQAGS